MDTRYREIYKAKTLRRFAGAPNQHQLAGHPTHILFDEVNFGDGVGHEARESLTAA